MDGRKRVKEVGKHWFNFNSGFLNHSTHWLQHDHLHMLEAGSFETHYVFFM